VSAVRSSVSSPAPLHRDVDIEEHLRAGHAVSRGDVRMELDMEEKGLNFEAYFQLHMVPEWRHKYLDFRRLSRLITALWEVHDGGPGKASLFERTLEQDMHKVSSFYVELEHGFVARHLLLVGQIARCASLAHPHNVGPQDPAVLSIGNLKQHVSEMREAHKLHAARDVIRKAIVEHERGVEKVDKFC
jgi:hypothetical protein